MFDRNGNAARNAGMNWRRWPYRLRRKSKPLSSSGRTIRAGFLDGFPEPFGGDPPVDGVSELGVADRGVEHDAGQLAEEPDHLVGGLGHGAAKLLEVVTGPRVTPPPGSDRTGRSSRRRCRPATGGGRPPGADTAVLPASAGGPGRWPGGRSGPGA